MILYASKSFEYADIGGKMRKAKEGDKVSIRLRSEEKRLRREKCVLDVDGDFNPVKEKEEKESAVVAAPNKMISGKKLKKKGV